MPFAFAANSLDASAGFILQRSIVIMASFMWTLQYVFLHSNKIIIKKLTCTQHNIQVCQIFPETQLHYSWPLRKISLDEQVDFLTYSTASETYVLGTSTSVEFKLPEDDELHPEWRNEGSLSAIPMTYRRLCNALRMQD